jgi:NAD/NADP transhydrogenase beta subunit
MHRELSAEDKKKRIDQDFGWINRISWLMDNQFKIGGFRFGLDPILNFIPLGGAIAGFATSLVLVIAMWRNGASPKLVIRMLLNISLDALLGSIPFLGNVFDFFSKANEKNIKLLKEHYYEGRHTGSGIGIILSILLLVLILVGATGYLIWLFFSWAFSSLNGISL